MDLKKQLRSKYRKWMNENVTKEFCLNAGERIKQNFQQRTRILPRSTPLKVSIFISKLPEISTAPLIEYFYKSGDVLVEVYIPAWNDEEMWMCHVPFKANLDDIISKSPSNRVPMPSSTYDRIPINVIIVYIRL